MTQCSAIIVDDEPNLAEHLQRLLEQLWPELNVAAVAHNGSEATRLIEQLQPQVVFLDIQMPGLSGLEVASAVPDATRIVFVTAHDKHAVSAFEHAAVDYLLKPVGRNRLRATVERLQVSLATTTPATKELESDADQLRQLVQQIGNDGEQLYLQWLRTGHGDVTQLIAAEEIIYFEADNKYTVGYTTDSEHVFRQTISALEQNLDPQAFWRIHRSRIVNVSAIEKASRDLRGRYALTLRGRKETVRASQRYSHLFRLS